MQDINIPCFPQVLGYIWQHPAGLIFFSSFDGATYYYPGTRLITTGECRVLTVDDIRWQLIKDTKEGFSFPYHALDTLEQTEIVAAFNRGLEIPEPIDFSDFQMLSLIKCKVNFCTTRQKYILYAENGYLNTPTKPPVCKVHYYNTFDEMKTKVQELEAEYHNSGI